MLSAMLNSASIDVDTLSVMFKLTKFILFV